MAVLPQDSTDKNVLGGDLNCCCKSPLTGFYRNGYCQTGPMDYGRHVVCAQVTAEFLAFSRARGNDLSTPLPAYQFPGLKPGDKWCLCAARWKEAKDAGMAPLVDLSATHQSALEVISLDELIPFSLPGQFTPEES
ncbi:MAG: DUF2237 domain-containing protein [Synechocystis sp.]|nr:DUF2237 domain-containing protein [Synechocystis sp.]